MVSKDARKVRPEVKKRVAEIDTMTLPQVQAALARCTTDLAKGSVTAYEGSLLTRAAKRRIKALQQ
jgi:hypothetical protein